MKVGSKTESSGEILAISFLSRPNVKIIGKPTGGYLSANEVIPLDDGGFFKLKINLIGDVLGNIYKKEKIIPPIYRMD